MESSPLVTLGRSKLRVPPIRLGTMTIGEQADKATSHRVLDRALERPNPQPGAVNDDTKAASAPSPGGAQAAEGHGVGLIVAPGNPAR